MARIAFVFAGQGAQAPGMGRSLAEASPAAAEVFRRVDALRPGTSAQCFEGTQEELMDTVNTQPCLWAVELAAAAALTEAGVQAEAAAGFSLGELAALRYANAVDFETGFTLVCRRAELMAAAANGLPSFMAAVLKLDAAAVERVCEAFDKVWPVNYNCPGQVAVAGEAAAQEAYAQAVREAGGRARMLKVSGAFHSPLMAAAAEGFGPALAGAALHAPRCTLYSNCTGLPYAKGEMKALLQRQICSPVRWQSEVEHMVRSGIDTFVELGPGKTLCGLIARIAPEARTLHVEDAASLAETKEALSC